MGSCMGLTQVGCDSPFRPIWWQQRWREEPLFPGPNLCLQHLHPGTEDTGRCQAEQDLSWGSSQTLKTFTYFTYFTSRDHRVHIPRAAEGLGLESIPGGQPGHTSSRGSLQPGLESHVLPPGSPFGQHTHPPPLHLLAQTQLTGPVSRRK